jgi:hypothetical protein
MFFSKILVISRLNGALEFLELGDRLSHNVDTENVVLPSMRRKTHSNPPSWKTIINSVSHDQFPCHSRRAHSKTISVLATYKDLVVSGSYDNLLKVINTSLVAKDHLQITRTYNFCSQALPSCGEGMTLVTKLHRFQV